MAGPGHATVLTAAGSATTLAVEDSSMATAGYAVVSPFTVSAELRRISSATGGTAGGTVTLTSSLAGTHVSGGTVIFSQEYEVPAWWFGATGDGGTDDTDALQQGVDETRTAGVLLDGGNRIYRVSEPLALGGSSALAHLNLRALPGFSPCDVNNAMLMDFQGNIRSFTASDATNTFTTSSAHGIPADDSEVLFKGASLPTGVIAGRVYYARDRAADTFKVAATPGGAAIDLTSDGSGTVYCEMCSTSKLFIRDVYVDGQLVTDINGARFSLQQPSYFEKLRIDNCDGTGMTLNSQQAVFTNLEMIQNRTALAFDGGNFFYFFGVNIEDYDTAVHFIPQANSIWPSSGGDGESIQFTGMHMENPNGGAYSSAASVCFDLEGGVHNLDVLNGRLTLSSAGPKVFYVHTGSAGRTSYSIRNFYIGGVSGITGAIAIDDDDRGVTLDANDDMQGQIMEFQAPALPSSGGYTDYQPFMVPGYDGRYMKWGGVNAGSPTFAMQSGTAQTAETLIARDSAGNDGAGISEGAYLFSRSHSAPADGDLQNGDMFIWFEQTAGVPKMMIKAKDDGGNVVTGSLMLSNQGWMIPSFVHEASWGQ